MQIQYFTNPPFGTNVYIVTQGEESLIVDPNGPVDKILKAIEKTRLSGIFLTHGHIDHISALSALHTEYPDTPIFTHEQELEYFLNSDLSLSFLVGEESLVLDLPFVFLKDREKIHLLEEDWEVFHTPGHTKGSLCYYQIREKILFSGDVLFSGSVGRTDFPGGNAKELAQSLTKLMDLLPDETIVYPGHGESTSIGEERRENPFVK